MNNNKIARRFLTIFGRIPRSNWDPLLARWLLELAGENYLGERMKYSHNISLDSVKKSQALKAKRKSTYKGKGAGPLSLVSPGDKEGDLEDLLCYDYYFTGKR